MLAIVPFAYEAELDQSNTVDRTVLALVLNTCSWISVLLQRTMTQEDITDAEKKWYSWWKLMKELFAHNEQFLVQKPNFHNTVHLFEFARMWGPQYYTGQDRFSTKYSRRSLTEATRETYWNGV